MTHAEEFEEGRYAITGMRNDAWSAASMGAAPNWRANYVGAGLVPTDGTENPVIWQFERQASQSIPAFNIRDSTNETLVIAEYKEKRFYAVESNKARPEDHEAIWYVLNLGTPSEPEFLISNNPVARPSPVWYLDLLGISLVEYSPALTGRYRVTKV